MLAESFTSKHIYLQEGHSFLSHFRIVYIPCNIYSMYVVAVSVRSGKECEVYSDAFSKVIFISVLAVSSCYYYTAQYRCTLKEMAVSMVHCGHATLRI